MECIPSDEMTIVPLNRGVSLDEFDCGDADLNEFLKKDSFAYSEKAIAKTYVALYRNNPVGFFSICTDAIRLSADEKLDELGVEKPHADYPALKIARLGVQKEHQKCDVGSFLVKNVIGKAIALSEVVGCRFVTVDAYPKSLGFYKKCNFIENQAETGRLNTSMRLDLISFFSVKN